LKLCDENCFVALITAKAAFFRIIAVAGIIIGFVLIQLPPTKAAKVLRSWVQIPPGPFLSVRELRYCFELILNKCRTNSAGSLHLATKKASYYILEEVSLNTSVTLKHYS
jgi:hypothetical protein